MFLTLKAVLLGLRFKTNSKNAGCPSAAEKRPIASMVLLADPLSAQNCIERGDHFLQEGNSVEAINFYEMALAADQTAAIDHLKLCRAYVDNKQILKAFITIERAIQLDASNPHFYFYLGNIYLSQGDAEKALPQYNRTLTMDDNHEGAHFNAATCCKALNNWELAAKHYEALLKINPERLDGLHGLVDVYKKQQDIFGEVECYRKILAVDKANVVVFKSLLKGLVSIIKNNPTLEFQYTLECIECGKQLIALNPTDPGLLVDLSYFQIKMNDFDAAIDVLKKALLLKPDYIEAHYNLSMLINYSANQDYFALLQRQFSEIHQHSTHLQGLYYFAYGKANEEQENFELAFECYEIANELFTKKTSYDRKGVEHYIDYVINTFNRTFFDNQQKNEYQDDALIYILGMPSSGSTLLETMLSNHHLVTDVGESTSLFLLDQKIQAQYGHQAPQYLLSQERIATSVKYGNHEKKLLGPGKRKIVNKQLKNFMGIGLMYSILPKAKIIHIKRDPLDCCFSIFSRSFSELSFSYQLDDIAHYYLHYKKLMQHWHSLPTTNMILDVEYERLVSNPKEELARILDFVDLPWQEECLHPEISNKVIDTASLVQAHKPITTSSVGRAKHFLSQLKNLQEILNRSI